jgi:glucose/arabinose dehydrogenase
MHLRMAARPSVGQSESEDRPRLSRAVSMRSRVARACMGAAGAVLASLSLGAATASADAGKVLVFTGTAAETPNADSGAIASAIQALGSANDFTVDVTSSAAQINASNLDAYRAVVFVHSAGDVLNAAQEEALLDYVNGGGGFVGIGETALLEQGNAPFNTLLGLSAQRVTGNPETAAWDIEFLDRVHPASRDLPLVWRNTETWYNWQTNPTGTVHTVARVRSSTGIPLPDGTTVTNDATTNNRMGQNASNQPQGNRAAAWCRDTQLGRSFYTELGSSAASVGQDHIRKHLLGAIQWAAGMVRGNCKATINSNYQATRITPVQSGQSNELYGEMTKSALADDGRVFYGGRAICFSGQSGGGNQANWNNPTVGLGCGTVHVWDPRIPGSDNQNPAKISKVAELTVYGNRNASEWGQQATSEAGLVGMALDPDFTKGRPYMYILYYPYYKGEQGKDTEPALGGGFERLNYMGEKRLSRFTYDDETKSFVPGSEKVIMSWRKSVYNCCHSGAGMDFDSAGNLYISTGDNGPNGANANNGGYTNPHPQYTIPCPGRPATEPCGTVPEDERPPGTPETLISFGDMRSTSGNTNNYEGKIIRIKPLANPGDTPGIGTTYTIPGPNDPNGPNLFPPDSEAVTSGKAKPEIFAMGVRSDYTIHIDEKTDAITTAWIGPDQGTQSPTWGPAKTENATMMNSAGNWGWPFCQAGNRWSYRAKIGATSGGGQAAPFGHPNTVGGGVNGDEGGFFDCSKPIVNDSPYNDGLEVIPAPKPVNIWYGPHGGCYGFPKNANGVGIYPQGNTQPSPTITRACPWVIGGSQAPIDGGIYRKPAGDKPNAWPEYWDGRWFMIDFANTNATRHALLMDPATQFNGGAPVAVDSLYGIVTTQLIGGVRPVFMDFGADGALYVGSYAGNYYQMSNSNMGVWRFTYIGGPDTPGPDPKVEVPSVGSKVKFSVGNSGGVSYTWDFGDGSPKVTTTEREIEHTYSSAGNKTATLTVNYADGEKASAEVTAENVPQPLFTSEPGTVTADVPLVLSLSLGAPANFGSFLPSVERDYDASTTANVLATSGDATLSVSDPATGTTGHLVNGDYTLPSPLQVKASSTKGQGGAFAPIGGSANPTTLLTYTSATNDPTVSLDFRQHVGATDTLRAGSYSKTLTFTLATTQP